VETALYFALTALGIELIAILAFILLTQRYINSPIYRAAITLALRDRGKMGPNDVFLTNLGISHAADMLLNGMGLPPRRIHIFWGLMYASAITAIIAVNIALVVFR